MVMKMVQVPRCIFALLAHRGASADCGALIDRSGTRLRSWYRNPNSSAHSHLLLEQYDLHLVCEYCKWGPVAAHAGRVPSK
jgi:hypothetical protein